MADDPGHSNGLQRDLGRLEGKLDSVVTSLAAMGATLLRADAERENLSREVRKIEADAVKSMADLRESFEKTHGDLKSKLYWFGGLSAAGGAGIGAGTTAKALSILFGH